MSSSITTNAYSRRRGALHAESTPSNAMTHRRFSLGYQYPFAHCTSPKTLPTLLPHPNRCAVPPSNHQANSQDRSLVRWRRDRWPTRSYCRLSSHRSRVVWNSSNVQFSVDRQTAREATCKDLDWRCLSWWWNGDLSDTYHQRGEG